MLLTVFVDVHDDMYAMVVVVPAFHAHSCSSEFKEKHRWLPVVFVVIVYDELDF